MKKRRSVTQFTHDTQRGYSTTVKAGNEKSRPRIYGFQ